MKRIVLIGTLVVGQLVFAATPPGGRPKLPGQMPVGTPTPPPSTSGPGGFGGGADSAVGAPGGAGGGANGANGAAGAPGTPDNNQKGFTSKKTGKNMAKAGIEDITNEDFPDMIESFDYPNAEVSDLVKAISELTGKNFIVDPAVRGKITIIAPSRITVAEAYKAFLSALAINGLAVVPGDGFYKIKQARAAQRDNIDTFSGSYYPTSDQMITRIIKLKYISADEVNKQLRILTSKDGELVPYTPTNALIVSDYGANMDRIMKILEQLDVQGFEDQMEVIRVKYAKSKDIADLVMQIINKGEKPSPFGAGVPRFRPAGVPDNSGAGSDIPSVSLADERTNSIIVVGNKAAIEKVRKLVSRLDYPLGEGEQGGAFVYYLRHAEAEPVANIINGIATESKKAQDQTGPGRLPMIGGPGGMVQVGPSATAIFGGDIKVSPDKNTNSLVIVASKQDFETVRRLVAKLDIAKDQVFIKSVIMEMSTSDSFNWGINYYKFAGNTNGIGRMGFRGTQGLGFLDPTGDLGGVLGFGGGGDTVIKINNTDFHVPSLTGMINLFKNTTNSNILQTPEIMALNNEEATIEVGKKVPVAQTAVTGTNGTVAPQVDRQPVTTKLVITPYISPDTDSVKLKINQEINGLITVQESSASELQKNAISTTTRTLKTNIVVDSGDTAVMGGLVSDDDTDGVAKVPVLGDIPILGWLFKSTNKKKEKTSIVVFITPKIVRNAIEGAEIVDQKIAQRIDFIQQSMNGRDPHGRYIDELPRKNKKASAEKPEDESKGAPPGAPGEAAPPPEEPAVESF